MANFWDYSVWGSMNLFGVMAATLIKVVLGKLRKLSVMKMQFVWTCWKNILRKEINKLK